MCIIASMDVVLAQMPYTGKFGGGKIGEFCKSWFNLICILASNNQHSCSSLLEDYLPKISLPMFTDTLKMYLACTLTVAYLPNFSSPVTFTCTKTFPRQIFPMYCTCSYYLFIRYITKLSSWLVTAFQMCLTVNCSIIYTFFNYLTNK